MIYDVRDTGKTLEYGVRRSVTNLELQFHTDAPWLALPPEQVGLYCLNPAREGGVSHVISLATVHNELQRRRPDLLPRFYRPFPWDRQAEHAPGDDKVPRQPMFRSDGRRSEEHTSELQAPCNLVCRLLLEKKNNNILHRHFLHHGIPHISSLTLTHRYAV